MLYGKLNDIVMYGSRVAFGQFDGMHLGHRAVINATLGYEAQAPVILSFCDLVDPVIYTENEKQYLIEKMGIQTMYSMPKDQAEEMTAKEFAEKILLGRLNAKSVVIGENASIGSDKLSAEVFKALGKELGFDVDIIPVVKIDGKEVSTDAIKEALKEGNFDEMQKLMGHTYIMIGEVAHGKAEGRQHGMPTANLKVPEKKLFPPHGVYATLSWFDGAFYRGMTNIGLRPSADSIPVATIETWLLNFGRYIYGKGIVLECYKYVRGVKKFNGLDEVRAQIDKDIIQINDYMNELVASMKK